MRPNSKETRILVLGATGLIGSNILRVLSEDASLVVMGTTRSSAKKSCISNQLKSQIYFECNLLNYKTLLDLFSIFKPDVVINAVGHTKHIAGWQDALTVFPINSIFPHQLITFCEFHGSRLIHISTDCVFKGDKGMYTESDIPDALDMYGLSKALGEIDTQGHITIRTSTIGHELNTAHGLLNWFLAQSDTCKGYIKAIFSGLPTLELGQVIRNFVLPNKTLSGVYNVAAMPINKYDLLQLIANVYGKSIDITVDETVIIDRSLNGTKFNKATGYKAPDWPELIQKMYASR